ncbi:hypothetical protein KBD45_06765 [Candidatus Dojkabacteria bacterium]|nr:hypothetical protein [Candidatus Dojkabacteria bacterium]
MRHLIVTCSDKKYGDFLVEHWLKSLKENVNLHNIDIVVLDYGLTHTQLSGLKGDNIRVIKCIKDGHVTSLRYRDLLTFLQKENYDQVLMVDGGDIIFQSDVSTLFGTDNQKWKGVEEDTSLKFDQIYQFKLKSKEFRKKVIETISGKKFINGGFIISSSKNFISFCKLYLKEVKDLGSYGIDQALITYYIRINNYELLDKSYNFMVISNFNTEGYIIKENQFYKPNGDLIHVVHNPGKTKLIRGMSKFGYKIKPKHNVIIYISKLSSLIINFIISAISKLLDSINKFSHPKART